MVGPQNGMKLAAHHSMRNWDVFVTTSLIAELGFRILKLSKEDLCSSDWYGHRR